MTSTTTITISISGIPLCPISHERLQDPVILDCVCKGTLSRSSFVTWYQHQDAASTWTSGVPRNCPICGSGLRSIHVVPNVPLREILEAMISSSPVDEPTSPINTAVRGRTRKQVGQDLVGDEVSVALSTNGNRIAIGDHVQRSGRVRVYDWTGCRWVQVGPDMVGSHRFGQAVALSSNGDRVAIGICPHGDKNYGRVRVYDWAESDWTQVGNDLVGKVAGDWFGSRCALSSDGNRVAIAVSSTSIVDVTGHVQIFDWGGRQWTQAGSNLHVGENCTDITLSSDGNRLAIGSPYSRNKSAPYAGLVRIYDWRGNQWTQVGSNLVGQADGDWFGKSVALSSDGNRIAVGAPFHNHCKGYVRIYGWTPRNEWVQVGPDLVGMTTDREFGWSVALSSNGNRAVIGAPNLRKWGHVAHAEIYDWTGNQWRKAGSDLVFQANRGGFVDTVVVSSCGYRVAIVANCASGLETGCVRLYDLEESCS